MLKVLFISFEFHPIQTTGNFRAAKFVKYFRDFGIEPVVLCGEEESILQYYKGGKLNTNLNKEIPEKLSIFRVPFNKPYKPSSKYAQFFYYADPIAAHWKNNAKKKAEEILKIHSDIKAILVTAPPFSVSEIAYSLSVKYKLPIILDLRDAWSTQGQFPYFTRFHYWLNRYHEKNLLKRASAIISVTEGLQRIYMDANPEVDRNKFNIVYNSFDNYTFNSIDTIVAPSIGNRNRYIIGYIGSFYYNIISDKIRKQRWWKRKGVKKIFYYSAQEEWIYRSPYFLFKALAAVFKRHPDLKNVIYFGHIGGLPDWTMEMAAEFDLQKNIIDYGFIKSDELDKAVEDFSALLVTTEKISGNRSFCLPSKTFDYIKYKKPILAFVKDGDLKTFLETAQMATIIDPDELHPDNLKLENFLINGCSYSPNNEHISHFHARNQTELLSNIIINTVN